VCGHVQILKENPMSVSISRLRGRIASAWRNEEGFGIIQVMAGIIIGAIIAGAGALAIIGAIHGTQNEAAKTNAQDVQTAQEAYYLNTVNNKTGGNYGTLDELGKAELLDSSAPNLKSGATADGKDYWVASESKTGKVFVVTGKGQKPVESSSVQNLDKDISDAVAALKADDSF
jgi:type II secretory pathway pseudopilin PulG